MEALAPKTNQSEVNDHEEWFAAFINEINEQIIADKKELESGEASKQTRDLYQGLATGNNVQVLSIMRNQASNLLIRNIIVGYIKTLRENQVNPLKLAFDLSDNKILVWAEIKDEDETTEMLLIKVESIINGQFFDKTKIYLDSIIVEESDKLPVPPHYRTIQFKS